MTASPVTELAVPDTYPPLHVTEYPVDGVAVAFTVSPYLTVKLPFALAPDATVTLFPVCVTVSAFTLPFVGFVIVTVYVSLVNHI